MQRSEIRDVLLATAGVQTVGAVEVHDLAGGGQLVTARLGFGPSTPAADVVAIMDAARIGARAVVPATATLALEPEIAAPRGDANPPTDVFVIRGAE